jgi:hypothetical protein
MGSVGDCYDNALYASFFAALECEMLDRWNFRTPPEPENGGVPLHRRQSTPAAFRTRSTLTHELREGVRVSSMSRTHRQFRGRWDTFLTANVQYTILEARSTGHYLLPAGNRGRRAPSALRPKCSDKEFISRRNDRRTCGKLPN